MNNPYSKEYLKDVLIRFAYHSTGIEGNTLTLNDTRLILAYGQLPSEKGHSLREVFEVENHRQAFDYLFKEAADKRPFSPLIVRNFHKLLTDHILPDGGQYKSLPNYIQGAEFKTAEPFEVPNKIQTWCNQLNQAFQTDKSLDDTLTTLMEKHIEFERIHPFSDGNGRTGRMLINYGLVLKKEPILVIERKNRDEYIQYEVNEDVPGLVKYAKNKLTNERERMLNFYQTAERIKAFQKKEFNLLQKTTKPFQKNNE